MFYIYVYIQRVPKKCIHILRDVVYVKCAYIFLAPSVYVHIYVQRVPKNIYTSEGAKKMYTHFKRCYLCKMCIHFLAPSVCVYIYIYIHIYIYRECQKDVYTSEVPKNVYTF